MVRGESLRNFISSRKRCRSGVMLGLRKEANPLRRDMARKSEMRKSKIRAESGPVALPRRACEFIVPSSPHIGRGDCFFRSPAGFFQREELGFAAGLPGEPVFSVPARGFSPAFLIWTPPGCPPRAGSPSNSNRFGFPGTDDGSPTGCAPTPESPPPSEPSPDPARGIRTSPGFASPR